MMERGVKNKMLFIHLNSVQFVAVIAILIAINADNACADSPFLSQGVKEYAAGDYAIAAGHLGGALSSDFNNATLHYYLASCYVHLNQKDAAVREFRIAFALQPDGEAGRYSKQALEYLNADEKNPHGQAAGKNNKLLPKSDPLFDKTLALLKQQTDHEKESHFDASQNLANDALKRGNDDVQRTTNNMLDDMRRSLRRIGGGDLMLPPDAQSQIERLKQSYESRRNNYLQHGRSQVMELDKTAKNLEELLNQRAKPGEAQLVPAGTTLYIRNYATPTPTPAKTGP